MLRAAAVVLLGVVAAGCGVKARALAPIELPALEVPPAPPRVVEPAPLPRVEQVELVPDLPPPPDDPKPLRRSPREITTKENAKPEVKPDAPAPEPTLPPPAQTPQQPAPVLRTTGADPAAAERRIREAVSNARGLLNSIDYEKLTEPRRSAYDQAQNNIRAAEVAINESNIELAEELAQKAEKLARELQARLP